MAYTIRPARTSDVPVIRKLIDSNVESGRLLSKATVTLYEAVQEFCVAELSADATAAGCGALHVMWEDLAEIRTVAVREDCQGLGIGHAIVDALLRRARAVGVSRVFCLTFAVEFFGRHGFQPISGTPVAAEVYRELLRSYDEGVAEFLDLERVKPNTLGNTRMLLRLLAGWENEHRRCAIRDAGPAAPSSGAGRGEEEAAMWSDLAALTPPLVVCVAVLIGVAMLLRSQMSPKRRAERDERRRPPDQRS
jgi:amino-acid N-acetyltransferase